MRDLLSYDLLCMSALIPHPLYRVYEKFSIRNCRSTTGVTRSYPLKACAGKQVT